MAHDEPKQALKDYLAAGELLAGKLSMPSAASSPGVRAPRWPHRSPPLENPFLVKDVRRTARPRPVNDHLLPVDEHLPPATGQARLPALPGCRRCSWR
jgi:hypothetical protein